MEPIEYLFNEIPKERFTRAKLNDSFVIICTNDFCEFTLPENHSLWLGNVRIKDNFILLKECSMHIIKVKDNESYALNSIGMPYIWNFEIIQERKWIRFKRWIQQYFRNLIVS